MKHKRTHKKGTLERWKGIDQKKTKSCSICKQHGHIKPMCPLKENIRQARGEAERRRTVEEAMKISIYRQSEAEDVASYRDIVWNDKREERMKGCWGFGNLELKRKKPALGNPPENSSFPTPKMAVGKRERRAMESERERERERELTERVHRRNGRRAEVFLAIMLVGGNRNWT
ncbi:hypothetical protein Cgig2_010401 [Carnegiea gigantea]|uniref:Uncharacterized protein n=1 Tax=Carnegiea gigantea TaxID=171969 RepID=A0A9Q1JP33_9CARY|nr:hypothetical protein Cgig2_010401 [Carnegiea gigantea]